jgi:hypothetical protein
MQRKDPGLKHVGFDLVCRRPCPAEGSSAVQRRNRTQSVTALAGGLGPSELCGLKVLYPVLKRSVCTLVSFSEQKISMESNSSPGLLLKLSLYPFSQPGPGSM